MSHLFFSLSLSEFILCNEKKLLYLVSVLRTAQKNCSCEADSVWGKYRSPQKSNTSLCANIFLSIVLNRECPTNSIIKSDFSRPSCKVTEYLERFLFQNFWSTLGSQILRLIRFF